MRDNGLTATAYTSLGRIDPLVAEPVLDALKAAGIAAYCENQSEALSEALTEVATPEEAEEPARIPVGYDEIFVDAEAVEQARPVIDRSTEDAEWKGLVEQFNKPSAPGHDGGADPVPRWPVSEDVDEKYEPLIDVPTGLTIKDDTPDEDEAETEPAKKADDPHEHFVPPEPPRGPRLDWVSRLAWLGLLGGPLLLIAAAVLDFGTGRITTLAVAGFIGGFLTLVLRMKDRLPPGNGGDDGAVV